MALQDNPLRIGTGEGIESNQYVANTSQISVSRRRFVAGGGAAVLTGIAGCTTAANWIADLALGDVNLFNETEEVIRGTIEITAPDETTVLQESFELVPTSDDDNGDADGDDENVEAYDDVWTESGTYQAHVELADGISIRGDTEAETSFTIEDPTEKMLAVPFGADEFDDGIVFRVADDWSEFGQA